MTLKFRPHHFLCTLSFKGKGYSPAFVANYQKIADTLHGKNGDDTLITVVADTADHICRPCPNRRDRQCATQEKVIKLDKNHAQMLQIKPGDSLTWGQAKAKIRRHASIEQFHKACDGCSWKQFGMCEQSLKALLES